MATPGGQAAIMAGGCRSRSRSCTDTVPKTMIGISGTGRSILDRHLDRQVEYGVSDARCGADNTVTSRRRHRLADRRIRVRATRQA
jgi:NDP-sugar pyrophosphorylase family protein